MLVGWVGVRSASHFAASSPSRGVRQAPEQVDGQREDDGGVLFGGDLRQRLQVAQLQRRRRLVDDVSSLLERARRLLLTLSRDHLSTRGGWQRI